MVDRESIIRRLAASDGKTALTMPEWCALNFVQKLSPERAFLRLEARRLGITAQELIDAADRTTVFVDADIAAPNHIAVEAYIYEIQDAPAQGMMP